MDSLDSDLIWQVKLHPELYNAQHIDFQNSQVREAAWKSIANKLNLTTYLSSTRWYEFEKSFREMIIARRRDLPHKKPLYSRQLLFLAPFIHAEEDILSGKISGSTERSIANQNDASKSPDPLIDFFLSMGKIVEQLDKKTQLEVKDKVFQMVRNAEMGRIQNKTDSFQPIPWLKIFIWSIIFILLFCKLYPIICG